MAGIAVRGSAASVTVVSGIAPATCRWLHTRSKKQSDGPPGPVMLEARSQPRAQKKVEGKVKKVDFVKFENTLEWLENDLWYAEEEERIRRNWN